MKGIGGTGHYISRPELLNSTILETNNHEVQRITMIFENKKLKFFISYVGFKLFESKKQSKCFV